MADKNDPISYAKYVRNLPSTERLLRQFLTVETGQGKNAAYARGHEFNFTFTQAERDQVFKLMEYGMSFEEAFDYWKALPESQRGTGP